MTSRLYCERMVRRPRAATIISGFLFAATVIAAIVGLALLFPGELLAWLAQFNKPGMDAFQALGRWAGLLLLTLAVGTASAATGLLRGKKWAWWFSVVLFAINGCGDVVGFFITKDVLRSGSGVVIAGAFLLALSRVKTYFNEDRGGRAEL